MVTIRSQWIRGCVFAKGTLNCCQFQKRGIFWLVIWYLRGCYRMFHSDCNRNDHYIYGGKLPQPNRVPSNWDKRISRTWIWALDSHTLFYRSARKGDDCSKTPSQRKWYLMATYEESSGSLSKKPSYSQCQQSAFKVWSLSLQPLFNFSHTSMYPRLLIAYCRARLLVRGYHFLVPKGNLPPEDEVRLMPRSLKSNSGMKSWHCCACDNDHRTLENHERDLFIEKLAVEPATEFRYSKDASDEDGEDCKPQA